jgi:Zn-dependent peptidase ImmA (M78 family)
LTFLNRIEKGVRKIMSLKVGTRCYSIQKWSEEQIEDMTGRDASEVCGFTDYYQSKIIVNASMAKDVREETLMHEILHTMLDNSGIEEVSRQVKEGANLSELVATILAPRLHALIKENELNLILENI